MKITKNKILFVSGIILVGLIIYIGQRLVGNSGSSSTQATTSTATVKKGSVNRSVSASGQVETANYLTVTTSVNGIVKQVLVKEGEIVRKGQKIMEITLNSDGEESLAQAWSAYLSAKNSLEKAKNDIISKQSDLLSAEEAFKIEKEQNSYQSHDERLAFTLAENKYKTAQAAYDDQQNNIKQAESNLNKAWLSYQAQSPTVVAPDSGTIANIVVTEGMDIKNSLSEKTSASVASIKKEGTPIVSLNVGELDISNIKVDQKVIINLNSIEGKSFVGKVVGIDKVGTTTSGVANYPVIVRFGEESNLVLPNMGVDAQIILEEKQNVILVPTGAITSNRGQKTVTVIKNGQQEQVKIETGISDGTNTEITSGLTEGAEVLINALPTSGFTSEVKQTNQTRNSGPNVFIR
jgi:RND family efflux transporter MFP subunit